MKKLFFILSMLCVQYVFSASVRYHGPLHLEVRARSVPKRITDYPSAASYASPHDSPDEEISSRTRYYPVLCDESGNIVQPCHDFGVEAILGGFLVTVPGYTPVRVFANARFLSIYKPGDDFLVIRGDDFLE
jgi:hypothetical protein